MKYAIDETTLTGIADAIRGKTGGTDPILTEDMATQIEGITGGGVIEVASVDELPTDAPNGTIAIVVGG